VEWLEANEAANVIPWSTAMNVHALLFLPLATGDRVHGVLTLVATHDRAFSSETRALGENVAAIAAAAIENGRLYQVATEASRARDDVLGVVSHDLRNPISAIAMCARILKEHAPSDAAGRAILLDTIGESTEWINRLIQDLLDVANIERASGLRRARQRPRDSARQPGADFRSILAGPGWRADPGNRTRIVDRQGHRRGARRRDRGRHGVRSGNNIRVFRSGVRGRPWTDAICSSRNMTTRRDFLRNAALLTGGGFASAGIDTAIDWGNVHDRDHALGLGYRVPMVIASPWSRGGCVNSQVFDHTSIMRFLET
jgi:hypothetical protein